MCKGALNHHYHPLLKVCVYQHCHPSAVATTLVIIISLANMYNPTLAESIKVTVINART